MKAWADSLGGISYPLLSDFWPHGEVCKQYGVLREEGYSERAIFVIDPSGKICYIDIHDIDEQPDNEILFGELEKIAPVDHRPALQPYEQEELPHGGVVIYCTQWCPDCKKLRAWLRSHNITYREIDVDHNSRAARQVREWSGGDQITPTIDIDGTILLDYDERKLTELLL